MRLILASKSPARRLVLRAAGLHPEVVVSGFDEHQVRDAVPSRLACRLAEAKAAVVVPQVEGDAVVIACDSVLEFEGRAHGKPGTREAAVERWRHMRGRDGFAPSQIGDRPRNLENPVVGPRRQVETFHRLA